MRITRREKVLERHSISVRGMVWPLRKMESFLNGNHKLQAVAAAIRFTLAIGRMTNIETDESNKELHSRNTGSRRR